MQKMTTRFERRTCDVLYIKVNKRNYRKVITRG